MVSTQYLNAYEIQKDENQRYFLLFAPMKKNDLRPNAIPQNLRLFVTS